MLVKAVPRDMQQEWVCDGFWGLITPLSQSHVRNIYRSNPQSWGSGGWFNIKMTSYQYRKSHCGDKKILRPSYLHNGISYTGKTTSLYWIRTLIIREKWQSITRVHLDPQKKKPQWNSKQNKYLLKMKIDIHQPETILVKDARGGNMLMQLWCLHY